MSVGYQSEQTKSKKYFALFANALDSYVSLS